MTNTASKEVFYKNQTYLQTETLSVITIFALVISYVWLWLNIWTVTGSQTPPSGWLGSGLLLACVLISIVLKKWHIRRAIYLLNGGLFVSTACAFYTFQSPAAPYFFIVPILFTAILLSQEIVLLESIASSLMILVTLNWSLHAWAAVITLLLVAVASSLSARHLHTTLNWLSDAYERARQNESLARERQAELRKILKALDEASYNLERANQRLIIERNEAESARRLKQQFAQTISHEIRTPLNLILGFIDVMAQSPEHYGERLPMSYMRDLSIVHKNAQHLQKLLNDVMDLSRIEAAQMNILPEEIDLATFVDDTVSIARRLIEMQGLQLCLELEPELPALMIDPARIRQVLLNLLNNAARFTDTGNVTVRVCHQEHEVIFSITDTGVGIPQQDLARIFREFEQVDGTTRRRYGGAGLGLSISQRFVELHGGRMWVTSEVGVGSVFSFSLPLKPSRRLLPSHQEAASNVSLLIVTPHQAATQPFVQESTMMASTLQEASQLLQRITPKAIVLDTCEFPMSSDAVHALAHQWHTKRIPIFAYPFPVEKPPQAASIREYLPKPVGLHRLRETLAQFTQPIRQILIVDDHTDFVKLLTRMLSTHAAEITAVGSGGEALALLQYRMPDLVFLDTQLPDMTGDEWFEKVRAQKLDIPVVMVSAQDEIDRADAMTAPVIIARDEPLQRSEVLHLIQRVCGI